MSESISHKKWFAIAHENHRNGGFALFRARLTLKIANLLTDVHKKNGIFDVLIRITPKMVCYSTQNCRNGGYARFGARLTLKMGRTSRKGQSAA